MKISNIRLRGVLCEVVKDGTIVNGDIAAKSLKFWDAHIRRPMTILVHFYI